MSLLLIDHESGTTPANNAGERITDPDTIAARLAAIGARFERWPLAGELPPGASQDDILAAYADPVARLQATFGFQSADVINVGPDHPQKAALRAKFLDEHTHDDFEVRFFVAGRGAFYLHVEDQVFTLRCQAGDLLSVPAGLRHWFDLGAEPHLCCIRLFTSAAGWEAHFTGDPVATRFPPLEALDALAAQEAGR